MDINLVVQELYSLPPETFTAARKVRVSEAKASGDSQLAASIHQLRKPSTVAWLANQLVREHPDEIQSFLELGAALREATETLSGDHLRELGKQRRQLVNALLKQVRELAKDAGLKVSQDTARDLESTLHAALADGRDADRLSAGRLTEALHGAGFLPASDTSSDEPEPRSPSAGTAEDESRRHQPASRQMRADRDEKKAREAVREAEESQNQIQATMDRSNTALQELTHVVDGLRASLEQAEVEQTRREKVHHKAQADLENAVLAAREAARRLDDVVRRQQGRDPST